MQEPCNHFSNHAEPIDIDESTPAQTQVQCSEGHANIVADCPFGACPSGKVLVSAGAKVAKVIFHAACMRDVKVVSTQPLVLEQA